MFDEHFRCWTIPPITFDWEIKVMRFRKSYETVVDCKKLYSIKDNEKPLWDGVLFTNSDADMIVEWLNKNVPDEPCKSFNEAVWDAIHKLWKLEEIEVSELDGEFVIHEIKPTNIVLPDIKHELDKYDVAINYQNIDSFRNVFVIKEKNDGC